MIYFKHMSLTYCLAFYFLFAFFYFCYEYELNAKFPLVHPHAFIEVDYESALIEMRPHPLVTYSSRIGYAIIDSKFNMSFYVSWK